jgi:uncharacterized protein (TIGR03435 family)
MLWRFKPQCIEGTQDTIRSLLSGSLRPNRLLILHYMPMRILIKLAYEGIVRDDDLLAEPSWLDTDRFDLIAKAARTPRRIPNG